MDELFDGSEIEMIEKERIMFEYDAYLYGFDLTRQYIAAGDVWNEYLSHATGHRWAGWLSASSYVG